MISCFKKSLILFFVLAAFQVSAQKFHGGIFAGIAASQISGDQLSGFNKAGFYVGGFSNFWFNEKSALQLELCFIQKGSSKNPRPKNNDYTVYKLNMYYLEMPLLYKWNFIKRFYFEAGPYLGVLMKTNNIEKDEYGLVSNSLRPAFKQFDLGVIGGFGVNIIDHLRANIRFENSVLPVRKPEVGTAWRLDRWQYNSTITLSVIYEIWQKKE